MAAGSLAAKNRSPGVLPFCLKAATLAELRVCNASLGGDSASLDEPSVREFCDDPERIGELADSLPLEEVFRYKFIRAGHINVNKKGTPNTWL